MDLSRWMKRLRPQRTLIGQEFILVAMGQMADGQLTELGQLQMDEARYRIVNGQFSGSRPRVGLSLKVVHFTDLEEAFEQVATSIAKLTLTSVVKHRFHPGDASYWSGLTFYSTLRTSTIVLPLRAEVIYDELIRLAPQLAVITMPELVEPGSAWHVRVVHENGRTKVKRAELLRPLSLPDY